MFDSSFDSEYDHETAREEYYLRLGEEEMKRAQMEQDDYNDYLEGVDEVNDQLYDWLEKLEYEHYIEDSYDSMEFFYKCYENIVHYSHLLAL